MFSGFTPSFDEVEDFLGDDSGFVGARDGEDELDAFVGDGGMLGWRRGMTLNEALPLAAWASPLKQDIAKKLIIKKIESLNLIPIFSNN